MFAVNVSAWQSKHGIFISNKNMLKVNDKDDAVVKWFYSVIITWDTGKIYLMGQILYLPKVISKLTR